MSNPPTKTPQQDRVNTRAVTIAEQRALVAAQKAEAARNVVQRQDAAGTSMERRAGTADAALASTAEAMAKARFFVAMQRPRDLERVREGLLDACAIEGFADEATWTLERYNSATKRKEPITGFSVRFAEAVRQALTNTDVDVMVVYDDEEKVIAQVVVTDLETNTTERAPVVVRKRKERRRTYDGQDVISTRKGSNGDTLYLVQSTDDEVQEAQNRAVAKAMRNAVLRLLRVDIKQACWDQVVATQELAAKGDDAALKLLKRFEGLGVKKAALEEWLGRAWGRLEPAEYDALIGAGRALKAEEATWAEILTARLAVRDAAERDEAPDPSPEA